MGLGYLDKVLEDIVIIGSCNIKPNKHPTVSTAQQHQTVVRRVKTAHKSLWWYCTQWQVPRLSNGSHPTDNNCIVCTAEGNIGLFFGSTQPSYMSHAHWFKSKVQSKQTIQPNDHHEYQIEGHIYAWILLGGSHNQSRSILYRSTSQNHHRELLVWFWAGNLAGRCVVGPTALVCANLLFEVWVRTMFRNMTWSC